MPKFPGYGPPQAPIDPRIGRSFSRPAMPNPGIPMKGQYRQGLPGGPGGGPGLGRQVQQMPGGWQGTPRPAQTPQTPQQSHPMQAALQAWLAGMPQGGDPAAMHAWMAQRPDFGNRGGSLQGGDNRGEGMRPPTLHGRGDVDWSQLMGGSQRGGIPFGGFRAKGGHVGGGKAYVVGEEGPEVVVPEEDGTVVPRTNRWGITQRGSHSGGGTQTPTPTPTPTTPGTWANAEYGVNEYGGKGHIPGETIQEYFKRNMLASLRGHAKKIASQQGGGGTPTPTTPTPTTPAIPLPPATGGVGVGGGPMSPGMAYTLNNMRPMRGFQFPQYTQTWAMNPDVFGRTY